MSKAKKRMAGTKPTGHLVKVEKKCKLSISGDEAIYAEEDIQMRPMVGDVVGQANKCDEHDTPRYKQSNPELSNEEKQAIEALLVLSKTNLYNKPNFGENQSGVTVQVGAKSGGHMLDISYNDSAHDMEDSKDGTGLIIEVEPVRTEYQGTYLQPLTTTVTEPNLDVNIAAGTLHAKLSKLEISKLIKSNSCRIAINKVNSNCHVYNDFLAIFCDGMELTNFRMCSHCYSLIADNPRSGRFSMKRHLSTCKSKSE